MRKKLREIMDKEEGFTLVELLAVIVILAIILAIAIPSVGKVVNKANTDATAAEKELVVDAGRLYFTSENVKKETAQVTADTLIDSGYLEPRSGKDIDELKTSHSGYGVVRTATKTGSGDDEKTTYAYSYEEVTKDDLTD